jgi:hypothetical protein
VLVLLALAVSIGLWLWLGAKPQPASTGPSAVTPETGQSAPSDAEARSAVLDAEPTRTELASAAPPAWDGSLKIHFRARSEDGSWDSDGDGRAVVLWDRQHKWGLWTVQIQGGVGVLPPKEEKQAQRERLEFDFVRLGGRRARVLDQPVAYPAGPDLTVDCEYLPSCELVVYEGPGQVHATGLQLALAADFREAELLLPIHMAASGPAQAIGSGLSSPITLEDRDGTIVYFVRNEVSAWSRIAVDHETPGTRYVHLRPGGRVEFTVYANSIRPEMRLRIFELGDDLGSARSPSAVCTLTPEGKGFIDGMGVGSWEVRAELGNAERGKPVLGWQAFSITAGATSEVALRLMDPPTPPELVRVTGEILLSEQVSTSPLWKSLSLSFSLDAQDPWSPEFGPQRYVGHDKMRIDPSDHRRVLWDAGQLTPGPWLADLGRFMLCESWSIEPGKDNHFVIDLTDLRTIRFRVVERESRNPVPLDELYYSRMRDHFCSTRTATLRPSREDPVGEVTLRALEGAYTLEFIAKSSEQRQVLELSSLGQGNELVEVEFSSEPPSSILVTLHSQGSSIPLPSAWWRQVRFAQRDGKEVRPISWSMGGSGQAFHQFRTEFRFAENGPVEIRFPPTDEFLELPPATVELVAGETSQLEIDLVPVP